MSIKESEFKIEKNKFKDTENWISNEIKNINQNDSELKNKIAELKKKTKGKYNEELETMQKLYNITHKNLEKYIEAEDKPYFARIDFREKLRDKESYYIGKFGLGDSKTGDEIVIDWRAPIADLYYSGVQGETSYEVPGGFIDGELGLKRKFLIRDSKLEDAFDEDANEIILKNGESERSLTDEFLKINLEESVSSKLKDVVATIQKEQNDIIRAQKNAPLIVQGSAGSGKTTIALHRLAYLLYKYSKTLSGKDILVIAPNKVFLDYISDVLPNLGVDAVKQLTFEEMAVKLLKMKGKVITKDKKLASVLEDKKEKSLLTESSRLKGSLAYKNLIDNYIKYIEDEDAKVEDIKVDEISVFKAEEIKRLFTEDMIHLPIDKRKDEIKRYFNIKLKERLPVLLEKISFKYDYKIARTKRTMPDSEERRKILTEIYDERDTRKKKIVKMTQESIEKYFESWKHEDTRDMFVELLNNDEMLKGIATKKLWEYIKNEFILNEKKGYIDSDDLAALMYLKFNIEGVPKQFIFKHIVMDEAQDYSEFQYSVIKYMAQNDSFTIVGDIGQGIYFYKGIENWKSLIENVFKDHTNYVQLTQSYRSTVEIIKFANKVLKQQKNSFKPAEPVLRHGEEPKVIEFKTNSEFTERLDEIVKYCDEKGKKNIAVIGRTYDECKKIQTYLKKYSSFEWEIVRDTDKNIKLERIIIPSYMTKGLEFDCSIIFNCSKENYGISELDKKILYVALTRALHMEYVFYKDEISPLIK
ncbi:MAG: RNA polymerase recycling motor HelD [Clostridium sp.]|nr:RNA polymerase recycling motor HelD [Clostridium sp.]